ncbi:protein of unknown function [Nitrospira defluvii]|uniref:Uncharacterized protein n=1 Tax=Nitrospira defluvii TaxID=330214 RepID=D8PGT8_9BACT|nr:protein of unknown function [Nitrospira defluvii]
MYHSVARSCQAQGASARRRFHGLPLFSRRLTVNSHATYDDELINHPPRFIVTTYE